MISSVVVPPEVFESARDSMGVFFEPISGIDRSVAARDFVDTSKSIKRAEILERYVGLRDKKVLEIGSGFGTNVAAWILAFNTDGYGVEPSSPGFDAGYVSSRVLLVANDIDPARIVNSVGEQLPFDDASFDIVYSANVLEHTTDPSRVLSEAMRVLRPGGILHMEIPNHLSYFEGHYMVFQPPLVSRAVLPIWVKLLGRDPSFSKTLRTEINPRWCRRTFAKIAETYPLEVITLGEELFLDRLARPFKFETEGVSGRLGTVLKLVQIVNRGNWIGKIIVAAQGYYPMYVTVRRISKSSTK